MARAHRMLSSGSSIFAGLRVFRQADHDRLGPGTHGTCLGRVDEAPRIHAIRVARGRFGRGCLHCDGQTGASGIAWHSHQLPWYHSTRHCKGAPVRRPGTIRSLGRRKTCIRAAQRPQTLYGLADSPVGLAAWLFDHGDGYGQPAAAITSAVLGRTINGHPAGDLTRDDVLDDITLYWLTNTAISSARLYWENRVGLYNAVNVSIPAAVSVFPGEN